MVDDTTFTTSRRRILEGIGGGAVGSSSIVGTSAAIPSGDVQEGQVAIDIAPNAKPVDETISVGPSKQVDLDLAYVVPVKSVKFAGGTCTTTLTPRQDSEFAIGLHAPNVGNGDPDTLSSLVGVTPYLTGEHERVPAVVWAERPPFFPDSENVPPSGDTEITATLWHGPTCFPPRSGKNCLEHPPNCPTGPIETSGGLVYDTEVISF